MVFAVRDRVVYSNGKPLEKYKIRVVWDQLRRKEAVVTWYSSVWKGFTIPSNSFFVWLIMKGRLATRDTMVSWGFPIDIGCVLCDCGIDSKLHLFWDCSFSKQLLSTFLPGISWGEVIDFVESNFKGDTLRSKVSRLLWCTLSSSIWRERCARVHGVKHTNIESIIEGIQNDVKFFALGRIDEATILAFI
ncbi:hypothetical protein LINPERHAP1_LOCUS26592 [Linum perenne]